VSPPFLRFMDSYGLAASGLAFVVGAVVGSFLNVVIARLPNKESLVLPPSHCVHCNTAIAWYDNIPLLSFLWLRGRCRHCAGRISARYPVVEAATAALFAASVARFGVSWQLVPALLLIGALIAITGIDLEHYVIPDVITLPGIVAGVLANVAIGAFPVLDLIIGIVLMAGIFLAIIVGSRGGMGGGDMKLAALLGAFLGWKVALLSLFVAVVFGGVFAVALLLSGQRGRRDAIPFGPFLAAGGAVGLFAGERLVTWYLRGFAA